MCPRCVEGRVVEPASNVTVRAVVAAALVRCPAAADGCKWMGPLGALDAHWAVCLMACPRGCGASLARRELGAHARVCPREPVACAITGCSAVVARSELAAHIGGSARATAQHLGSLAVVRRQLPGSPHGTSGEILEQIRGGRGGGGLMRLLLMRMWDDVSPSVVRRRSC